jgi:hypothetical protein
MSDEAERPLTYEEALAFLALAAGEYAKLRLGDEIATAWKQSGWKVEQFRHSIPPNVRAALSRPSADDGVLKGVGSRFYIAALEAENKRLQAETVTWRQQYNELLLRARLPRHQGSSMKDFTVPSRIKVLGIDATNEFSWIVGAAVRDRYEAIVGEKPMKALRRKTYGVGSHCFAVYPPEFQAEADLIILGLSKSMQQERDRQGNLFPENEPNES